VSLKKAIAPVRRAELVNIMAAEHGLNVRQACRAALLVRSAYYAPVRPKDDASVVAVIETYIGKNQQHGFVIK
jgi:hypothetical protein